VVLAIVSYVIKSFHLLIQVRVRALPSIKLLKKNALKKTRKGEAYDASKREREEGKEKLYEVINDDDEEMADE